jgi:hypothetical protein
MYAFALGILAPLLFLIPGVSLAQATARISSPYSRMPMTRLGRAILARYARRAFGSIS